MFCHAALCSPPFATLTYALPRYLEGFPWKAGLRAAVPLGKGAVRCAVILSVFEENDLPEGTEVRSVVWPLDKKPLLSGEYLTIVEMLASRHCLTPGRVLGNILPQGLRVTERIRVREFSADEKGRRPRMLALRSLPTLSEAELQSLAHSFSEGRTEILRLAEDSAETEICGLACDPPWPVRPAAVKQRQILDWLLQNGAASRKRLREALPGSSPALAALIRHKLIEIRPQEAVSAEEVLEESLLIPPDPPFSLSGEQVQALEKLRGAMDALSEGRQVPFAHLLFGVTGSGKTAVYLELAQHCLRAGRSAMLLAPEVAIALKLKRDAELRFPQIPVFLHHGYQNPQVREALFRKLALRDGPCLVIGTRSAVFLPLRNIGVIILDEEHDSSFKQEERLPYHAKEVAWERARRQRAVFLLGSATPDIKTFYAASRGILPLIRMQHRVGGGRLPEISLLDIRGLPSHGMLSQEASEALRETVRRGEQAVVLLNRRGYAPLMYCLGCNTPARCPHCGIALTYHKKREQLVCHYCGFTRPWPSPCDHCGGINFLPMGEGTEQLEEKLAREELAGILPPGGKVLRLDRDSTSRQGRMEEILAAFARQEGQVLVGTQMLSKGHHFPNVTLALIADGDMGLNLPDYRAAERTFQLLVQASGRAGRGTKPGRVLIQTRDPGHYCWQYVQSNDYEGFYEKELETRRTRRYPPFVKLALVRLSWPRQWQEGNAAARRFSAELRSRGRLAGISVLGPAPAPLAMLQGRVRFQCLIKAQAWQEIRGCYAGALQAFGGPHEGMRISLDLDPVTML